MADPGLIAGRRFSGPDLALALVTIDEAGTIVDWNDAARNLFGWTREEAVGRVVGEVMVPWPGGRGWGHEQLMTAGQGQASERLGVKGYHRGGGVFRAEVTVWPDEDGHGPRRFRLGIDCHTVRRDADEGRPDGEVTDHRSASKTPASLLRSLETALAQARESEARYRRFTADVAHQLRTPMAGIRACAETLLDDPPLEVRDALLLDVVREADRTGKLVHGLLQIARMDQGQLLVFTRCDLVGLCGEEVERAGVRAPHLQVALVVNDPPADAKLDGHAVREILANLLDNARRHAAGRIEVVVGRSGGDVEVRVTDDGPGVARHMEERVFERFVSADGRGGSGLGLAIARGLARSHGGDLTCSDGAFILRVPAVPHRDCGGAGAPDFPPVDGTVAGWGPWLAG